MRRGSRGGGHADGATDAHDICVIIVSAQHTLSDDQALGLESGADGYIARPVGNRELLARIEACAGGSN